MRRWARALMTLLAAAAAGLLVWFAPHFHRGATGGFWGVIGLMTLAGLLVGLSQLHGRDGNPSASLLVAFVPVLVAAGWVILAVQPQGNWVRDHVLSWSGEIGIGHAVHNLGEHVAVLAFGLGIVFGVTFEPRMVRGGSKKVDAERSGELAAPGAPPDSADLAEDEPTVVDIPAQRQQVDAGRIVELAAPGAPPVTAGQPTVVESHDQRHQAASADLAEEEPTVVQQAWLGPAPPLTLPSRFTQSWFVSHGPRLHPKQVPVLFAELHRRGWTEDEIQQRVIPHLPHWPAERDASALSTNPS
jgi:hypothetical protein